MPLKKDPEGGGTNADGTKNSMYCSYCYKDGYFTQPDISATEMQQFVKRKIKEMGFPGFLTGFFTRGIPKLERWKNQ
ncbi:zinc ribbon domain-containing protein [Fulvivirgaceae bacterium BMA12]|uniref:Zinc ribbon domain-containing protein n=1 Tax=Agaribacillus aureus TaxID=3051825 RepID=A0ABT8LC70_9BACT|nr:zinc ribbon domain-containing protein [Fulvivirgaceae bacterium BMA12]